MEGEASSLRPTVGLLPTEEELAGREKMQMCTQLGRECQCPGPCPSLGHQAEEGPRSSREPFSFLSLGAMPLLHCVLGWTGLWGVHSCWGQLLISSYL